MFFCIDLLVDEKELGVVYLVPELAIILFSRDFTEHLVFSVRKSSSD